MATDDPYDRFAPVYDKWQALYPRPFSLAMTVRMEQAWEEFGVPELSLLDLACGTGTLATWWVNHHPEWKVAGVDRSELMIGKARAQTPPGTGNPRFAVSDITRLDLSGLELGRAKDRGPERSGDEAAGLSFHRFGMVTCFFDSLNHITRSRDLKGVLRGARRSLLEDGLFVFDLIDEDNFPEIFGSPWIVQDEGLYVGCESNYFERRGASFGRVRFTFFEKDGPAWQRRETEILERAWPREEFDPMVEEAGLEIIHIQLIDPEEQEDVFVPRRLYVCRPR